MEITENIKARIEMQESGIQNDSGAIPVKDAIDYILEDERSKIKFKKVYIAVPTEGRTHEAIMTSIREMHKMAEIVFGEMLTPVHSYCALPIPERVNNDRIYKIGKNIELLSECDCAIGIYSYNDYDGSDIIRMARHIGLPTFEFEMNNCWFCKDILKRFDESIPVPACDSNTSM